MEKRQYDAPQDVLVDILVDLVEGNIEDRCGRRQWLNEALAEKLSATTPVIEATVARIIADDSSGRLYGENGGWWLGTYVKDHKSDLNQARIQLAEHFGAARNRDLEEQAAANLDGAKRAVEEMEKERRAMWDWKNKAEEFERQLRHLRPALDALIDTSVYACQSSAWMGPNQDELRTARMNAVEARELARAEVRR